MGERQALAYAHLDALADQRDELLAEMGHIHAALARTLRASGFDSGDGFAPETDAEANIDLVDRASRAVEDDGPEDRNPTHEQPVII